MINQGVFIGLGGAGVYSTAHLKARLLEAVGGDKSKLYNQCRFLFIDTDTAAYNKMNEFYSNRFGNQKLIDDDWVPLYEISPVQIFRRAREYQGFENAIDERQSILSFVDEKSAASFKPNRLEDGASANRQQGRVAVWAEWQVVQRQISTIIENLRNPDNPDSSPLSIPFYILSGTCGGTGSSMFLDIAYLIDRTVKSYFKGRAPTVRAVLFMPEWYVQQYKKSSRENIIRKYQSNAYAFFEEFNYFLTDYYAGEEEDKGIKFEKVFVAPSIDEQVESYNKKWGVVNFAICIDSTSEQEGKFEDYQMYQNTAEMLYYWQQSEVQGAFISNFDNQLRDYYPGKRRVPAFITMGFRALQFPGELMQEYSTARFLYEFFKFGLINEEDGGKYFQSNDGKNWLNQVIDNSVRCYLFDESSKADLPNIEREAQPLLDNTSRVIKGGINQFTYNHDGATTRVRKLARRITGHTNSTYDSSKVGDPAALNGFINRADTEITDVMESLERDFTDSNGSVYRSQLASQMENSIEQYLVDAILAFGITGAEILAKRLLAEFRKILVACQTEQKSLTRSLLDREQSIVGARQSCLDSKDDKRLVTLSEQLGTKLVESHRLTIVRQQAALLEDMAGERGCLNAYIRSLAAMSREIKNRLTGASSDSVEEKSITEMYEKDLLTRFAAMRDNVTTVYLPSVEGLIKDGKYNLSHSFTQSYEQMIKQVQHEGETRTPLRHALSGDIWSDPKGMHGTIVEMFRNKETDDLDGTGGGDVRAFFRRYLRGSSQPNYREMVTKLEAIARRTIKRLLEETRAGSEIKGVEEVFGALSTKEKEALKQDFINRTETFCKMESFGDRPVEVSLYVGQSLALAAQLGYSSGSSSRFVESPDPNRFLHIKAKALWTIDQYPFYEQYRLIYQKQQDRRNNGYELFFSPHIHKLFNELGVESGMRRLWHPHETFDTYILTILYHFMFRVAYDGFFPLFKEMVYWNNTHHGSQATHISPIEGLPVKTSLPEIRIIEEVRYKDGKLLFEENEFKVIINPFNNFKQLFNKLETEHPGLFHKLQKVNDHFRQHCSQQWSFDNGPLSRAYQALDEMLNPQDTEGRPIPNETRDWYNAMRDRLYEIKGELLAHIRKQPKSTYPYVGSSGDDYEPELHREPTPDGSSPSFSVPPGNSRDAIKQ